MNGVYILPVSLNMTLDGISHVETEVVKSVQGPHWKRHRLCCAIIDCHDFGLVVLRSLSNCFSVDVENSVFTLNEQGIIG